MYSATDGLSFASGASGSAAPFYRVLALASSGKVLAASKAASPVPSRGELRLDLSGAQHNAAIEAPHSWPPVAPTDISTKPGVKSAGAGFRLSPQCRKRVRVAEAVWQRALPPTAAGADDSGSHRSCCTRIHHKRASRCDQRALGRTSSSRACNPAAATRHLSSRALQMARLTLALAAPTSPLAARTSRWWGWRARRPQSSLAKAPPAPAASFPSRRPTARERGCLVRGGGRCGTCNSLLSDAQR
jgi:hypothetical protein